MSTDENQQLEFIAGVCRQFAQVLNSANATRLAGQDAYEALSLVFGEAFTPGQLREASAEQLRDLAMAVWELLEVKSTPESVSSALTAALAAAKP